MALTYSQTPETHAINQFRAPSFCLPGVDGREYSLESFRDARALLVVFMCNHCPYVIAVQDRINRLARDFASQGLAVIGINPNDPVQYPEDSFEEMKRRAREQGYCFPYVQDLTQEVARAYGAVCTPDPYLFENLAPGSAAPSFVLRYHGRIDDNWKDAQAAKQHDLANAIQAVLQGKPVSPDQKPAMGCSIKWKKEK